MKRKFILLPVVAALLLVGCDNPTTSNPGISVPPSTTSAPDVPSYTRLSEIPGLAKGQEFTTRAVYMGKADKVTPAGSSETSSWPEQLNAVFVADGETSYQLYRVPTSIMPEGLVAGETVIEIEGKAANYEMKDDAGNVTFTIPEGIPTGIAAVEDASVEAPEVPTISASSPAFECGQANVNRKVRIEGATVKSKSANDYGNLTVRLGFDGSEAEHTLYLDSRYSDVETEDLKGLAAGDKVTLSTWAQSGRFQYAEGLTVEKGEEPTPTEPDANSMVFDFSGENTYNIPTSTGDHEFLANGAIFGISNGKWNTGYNGNPNYVMLYGSNEPNAAIYNKTAMPSAIKEIWIKTGTGASSKGTTYSLTAGTSLISGVQAKAADAVNVAKDTLYRFDIASLNATYFNFSIYDTNGQIEKMWVTLQGGETSVTPVAATSVTVAGEANVKVGEELQLTASVLPAEAFQGVTWTSSDETKATVDATGKVSGVAEGPVTITATSIVTNTVVGTKAVTVDAPTPVTSVTLAGPDSVKVGGSITLTATIAPENALKDITWSSSDETKATVDEKGKVTAIAEGTVTIKATSDITPTVFGEKTITVQPADPVDPNATSVTMIASELGLDNATVFTEKVVAPVTFSASKGTGSNDPKYYSSGAAIRCYGGNTFTISIAAEYKIVSVEITSVSGKEVTADKVTVSNSSSFVVDGINSTITATDGATEIVIASAEGNTSQFHFHTVKVNYAPVA